MKRRAAAAAAAAAETPGKFISRWAPILLVLFDAAAAPCASTHNMIASHPAIFAFGDSLSDTGNAALYYTSVSSTQPPYGETYPGWPTGRFSDGRLLVDLLAAYLDLPLLNPYLNSSANVGGGVNYAVGGATALNASFLNTLSIQPDSELSLEVQLSWHLEFKSRVASSNGLLAGSPTEDAFSQGLYVIEIGGNDYIYGYLANYSPLFINSTLVPLVVQKIRSVAEILISNGARNFLFVSITPLGCSPATLVRFDGSKDSDGCLEEHNLASALHGALVQREVANLRATYANATFLFMDFYGAYEYVQANKEAFGFVESLKACCGAGDDYPYNYNQHDPCNQESVSLCPDPSTHIIWDGVHFTDAFNSQIFNQTIITGSYLGKSHSFW